MSTPASPRLLLVERMADTLLDMVQAEPDQLEANAALLITSRILLTASTARASMLGQPTAPILESVQSVCDQLAEGGMN